MDEMIMMPLQDSDAYVPVPALRLSETLYQVLADGDRAPARRWRFPPDSIVRCELRVGGRMEVPVAIALAPGAGRRRPRPCRDQDHE